jgi:hypothetical protein
MRKHSLPDLVGKAHPTSIEACCNKFLPAQSNAKTGQDNRESLATRPAICQPSRQDTSLSAHKMKNNDELHPSRAGIHYEFSRGVAALGKIIRA